MEEQTVFSEKSHFRVSGNNLSDRSTIIIKMKYSLMYECLQLFLQFKPRKGLNWYKTSFIYTRHLFKAKAASTISLNSFRLSLDSKCRYSSVSRKFESGKHVRVEAMKWEQNDKQEIKRSPYSLCSKTNPVFAEDECLCKKLTWAFSTLVISVTCDWVKNRVKNHVAARKLRRNQEVAPSFMSR